jgi:diaminohydroxyphosphoribosylaminopyrimidine deaminase / 5-amino-6-(5-phosphoribosylamino)uracil reductase
VRRAIDNLVGRADVELAMRRAIDLARSTHPHPNPRVGAVILGPDGSVRASGNHSRPGSHHAEVAALAIAHEPGDTMVVTLEPCDHAGRTPPCTEAIIRAGISRVVIGVEDPDPRVRGRGVSRLREAGIDVVIGVLADEVVACDPGYHFQRASGRARITLKLASTVDGQVAAADGTSRWITDEPARRDAHRLRSEHDGILVGSGTVITDDPMLTDRRPDREGPQPRPIVVAGRRPIPPSAAILAREPIVYADDEGVDLAEMARDLPEHGILSVLVEGGPSIAHSLLHAGLVDELVWYFGPIVGAGVGVPAVSGVFATMAEAIPLAIESVATVGSSIRVVATPADRRLASSTGVT